MSINEKPHKLNEKIRRKTDHLLLCEFACSKKLSKSNEENEQKNLILIKHRNKLF